MILAQVNDSRYEYDVHSLVQAFYPGEEIKVIAAGREGPGSRMEPPGLFVSIGEEGILCRIDGEGLPGFGEAKGASLREESLALDRTEDGACLRTKLKRLLYRLLSSYTGIALPWGSLTGIRPVKLAYGLMEEGKSREAVLKHMEEVYDVSPQKAALSLAIAEREKQILSATHTGQGYSLYVGIPFCPTTCLYCSFTSEPIGRGKKRVDAYLTALEKEMGFLGAHFAGQSPDAVYIGGGTPTTLEPEELERLFALLQSCFDFSGVREFTVEAGRADSITKEKLKALKAFGVNRISVNPQTMNQKTLELIGRRHTVEQVKEAFLLARGLGFSNINMDLILGLPGETEKEVGFTMDSIRMLGPDSLTVHSLAVKRGSALGKQARERAQGFSAQERGRGAETMEAAMQLAALAAEEMGMEPYYLYRQKNMAGNLENVGYATKGHYGIYNVLMMEEKQSIAAMGAGAISKRVYSDGRIERCDTVKDVGLYMDKIEEMVERKRRLFEGRDNRG